MAEPRRSDGFLLLLYGLLLLVGMVLLVQGVLAFIQHHDSTLLGLGVVAVIVPASLYPIAAGLRDSRESEQRRTDDSEEALRLMRAISSGVTISDVAKRIAYRQHDREAMRKAIRDDIQRKDYDGAMVLVEEMAEGFGNREEAEEFRDEVINLRYEETERKVSELMGPFEGMLQTSDWDRAAAEAQKIQRLYPDSPRVRDLPKRVREARDARKHDLERRFLEAAQRDDVDRAMDLLKELDRYLSEAEAGPFRETARGVIGKKRENLGVQFKLLVHDKDWTQAVRIGEQIIREFPNSKMADEVRGLLDLLRERATSQQAAKAAV